MSEGVNDLLGTTEAESGISNESLAVGGMGISGVINGIVGADAKNIALDAQIRQTQRAVAAGTDRAELSASQQRRDRSRETAQLRDRLRATNADTGLSVNTLDAEATIRLAENMEAINLNLASQKQQLIISGTQNILGIQSQKPNALLAGISGGLTGLTSGIQIESFRRKAAKTSDLGVETGAAQDFVAGAGAQSVTTSSTQAAGVFKR